MGFKGSLTAGEIISQFINVDENDQLTNAVFIGIGGAVLTTTQRL